VGPSPVGLGVASVGVPTKAIPFFDKVERDLDPQEVIRVRRVPFEEALRMAITGEIRDAGSVAALCALRMRVLQSDLPDELAQRLK
jgi:hypothetical protein